MALVGNEPVSPTTSLFGSVSSGMGTYCLTLCLNDTHHSLVSTPNAHSESMHWPVTCRACSCDHNSRRRLLKIDTWCMPMTEAVTVLTLIAIVSDIYGWQRTDRHTDYGLAIVYVNFFRVRKTSYTKSKLWSQVLPSQKWRPLSHLNTSRSHENILCVILSVLSITTILRFNFLLELI